jgi:hypothetical protein
MPRLALPLCLALSVLATASAPARGDEAAQDSSGHEPISRAEVQALLDGLTEQMLGIQAETDKLRRIKLSGYVQVRAELGEASRDTVRVSGSPAVPVSANLARVFVRRGRIRLAYDAGPLSTAVLSIDGGQDRAVRLLDAFVTLRDWWTPLQDHQLTLGQFNVPFGYEIERSSAARELPERSRAENVLFSGERDRGLKLENQWTPRWRTVVGLLNGGGINDPDFPTTDPTRGKDFVARARWSEGWLDVAVSYLFGRAVTPLTGPDVWTDRERTGFDAQWFFDLPRLGGGSLAVEGYLAHQVNPDSVRALVQTVAAGPSQQARLLRPGADPAHLATDACGGYAMWVQSLGDRAQAIVRYDAWDPNTACDHDQYGRWSLGLNAFYDGSTRISVAYDAIRTEVATADGSFRDPADNLWTFQVQHRF